MLFDELNTAIYERAALLKCIKNENNVPINFRANNQDAIGEEAEMDDVTPLAQGNYSSKASKIKTAKSKVSSAAISTVQESMASAAPQKKGSIMQAVNLLKSNSKVNVNEDPALGIIRNILK